MSLRAEAAEATRLRIVTAAATEFRDHWYDDVSIRRVAEVAGVAVQTVTNHFASKEELFAAAAAHRAADIEQTRFDVAPGDVDRALDLLLDDYELNGDHFLRTLAVEGRLPIVAPTLAEGRAGHERWCAHVFEAALGGLRGEARRRRLAQLVVATDVYTWKLFRRDRGMSRDQTRKAMRELVLAVHEI